MFQRNEGHRQKSMFGHTSQLPKKQMKRLEGSWAGTFYQEVFLRIPEKTFAVLYSHKPSHPNIPVNILVGLEILKYAFRWTDEQMCDAFVITFKCVLPLYSTSKLHLPVESKRFMVFVFKVFSEDSIYANFDARLSWPSLSYSTE
jgi:hypothetical protein